MTLVKDALNAQRQVKTMDNLLIVLAAFLWLATIVGIVALVIGRPLNFDKRRN